MPKPMEPQVFIVRIWRRALHFQASVRRVDQAGTREFRNADELIEYLGSTADGASAARVPGTSEPACPEDAPPPNRCGCAQGLRWPRHCCSLRLPPDHNPGQPSCRQPWPCASGAASGILRARSRHGTGERRANGSDESDARPPKA
jgi:hypothetical protein